MDIWVISTVWLSWIVLLWIFMCRLCFPTCFEFWEYILRNGITGSYDNSMFKLLRSSQTVFHSNYTILHSHQQCMSFQFFHILTDTCYFPLFQLRPSQWVWSTTSLWFRIQFPWWLMILSIFSCACWPFVYHLWRNVYSNPLCIFKLGCLPFCCYVVRVLYVI